MKRSAAARTQEWLESQPKPLIRTRRHIWRRRGWSPRRSWDWGRRPKRRFKFGDEIRIVGAIASQGVTSNPTNGGSLGNSATIGTGAGTFLGDNAVAGDLGACWIQYKTVSTTDTRLDAINRSGQYFSRGQQGPALGTGNPSGRWVWFTFNGTWSGDLSFGHLSLDAASGTAGLTVVVWLLRPTTSGKHWVMDWCKPATFPTDSTSPFTRLVPGVTPHFPSNVTLVAWASQDDNEWGNLSGANWTHLTSPSAHFRNLQGTDMSCAFASQIQTSAAATGDVSLEQTLNGGDAGMYCLITFAEVDLPTGGTPGNGALVDSGMVEAGSSVTDIVVSLDNGPSTAGNTGCLGIHFETTNLANIIAITDDSGTNVWYQCQVQSDTGLDQISFWYFCPNAAPFTTVTIELDTEAIFSAAFLHEHAGAWEFVGFSGIQFRGDDDSTGLNVACPDFTPPVNGCLFFGMAFRPGGGDHDDLIDADGWNIGERAATEADVTHHFVQPTAGAENYDIDTVAPNAGSGGTAGNTISGFIVLKPATATPKGGTRRFSHRPDLRSRTLRRAA